MLRDVSQQVEKCIHRLVAGSVSHPRRVIAAVVILTLVSAVYAVTNLGVDMDNKNTLLSSNLPFQKIAKKFEANFPVLNDALLVVIDADTPDHARAAARKLVDALRARPDVAKSAYAPDADPFFERNGLLYKNVDQLETFSDEMSRFQPMLAELQLHPDIPTLSHLISQSITHAGPNGLHKELEGVLRHFSDATVAVYAERPLRVSWEDIIFRQAGLSESTRTTVVVDPVLDFNSLLPAGKPMREIRHIAASLGLGPKAQIRVRITGYPALNDEEMRGLFNDVGLAGISSFFMVLGLLALALRSTRIVAAATATLLAGLIWTAGFAALTVGRLNVVSVAFAVMFIGLGVDFAIHLGLHYADELRAGRPHEEAMRRAADGVGVPLALCALTTTIGFYAFIPTDYRGVAELGWISGSGMFVILLLTLTLFPALLSGPLRLQRPPRPGVRPIGLGLISRLRPGPVLLVAAAGAMVCIALAPRSHFDSNIVRLRNPNTESVKTWNDLLASGTASPWYVDVMAPNLKDAEKLGKRLQKLDGVSTTLTLRNYVPNHQKEKRAVLADVAMLLDVPDDDAPPPPPPSPAEQVKALQALHTALGDPAIMQGSSPAAAAGRVLRAQLGRFLARVKAAPDPARPLAELQKSLLGGFPTELARLREALQPQKVTLASLPPHLVERMLAPSGVARLQVFPKEDLSEGRALSEFVHEVRSVVPNATGLPVNVVEFGRATARSLAEAVVIAVVAIAGLLLLLWRRPSDVLRALLPLALAGIWTVGFVAGLDIYFNFVNVVVLPLLLGIGVDSGIHLVGRARSGLPPDVGLTETATARAVFWSAATTLLSFGTLAFSGHRGISSLGVLLVTGMGFTLLANLVVLPALLRVTGPGVEPAIEGDEVEEGAF